MASAAWEFTHEDQDWIDDNWPPLKPQCWCFVGDEYFPRVDCPNPVHAADAQDGAA